MKNWNFLNTEEIIWWTRKQNWYLNADTKTNTRFPSMTQRTVVSCIVRNHYIVTFLYIYCNFPFVNLIRLKIVGSMKLWEPNQSCISSNHYWKYSKIYIYIYVYMYLYCIYIYVYIHHWRIIWSSYRKLAWVGIPFGSSNRMSYKAMSSTRIQSQVILLVANMVPFYINTEILLILF